jgi:hypothetical protein
MTLSNFDWTDKTSVKWFIMLPTGHEGPYCLNDLTQKKLNPEAKVWAEGLGEPVKFKIVLENSERPPITESKEETVEDDIPPLPPIPGEEDLIPPLPAEEGELPLESQKTLFKIPKAAGVIIGALLLLIFGIRQWVQSKEEFSIRRQSRMSPKLFQRISTEIKFEGWDKKIFFKEYIPMDMSHIWLVTSAFHRCDVEAMFTSVKGKLLTIDTDEELKVSFRSEGDLDDHIVEFSRFEFTSGNKIIPGLYEMDLKATRCEWDGVAAKLANLFGDIDEEYITRMKVVLYHKGNVEFNLLLDKLIRKKMEAELKNQNQEELFWQDLQQKLQTLLAISLQVEQLLLDLVEKDPTSFQKSLRSTVDAYTRKYGSFLTGFVVANEDYFKELESAGLSNMGQKRSYESLVKITAKNVGFESIKIIEELQSMKKPSKTSLKVVEGKIVKKFEQIKEIINTKIIQVTEDRSK